MELVKLSTINSTPERHPYIHYDMPISRAFCRTGEGIAHEVRELAVTVWGSNQREGSVLTN